MKYCFAPTQEVSRGAFRILAPQKNFSPIFIWQFSQLDIKLGRYNVKFQNFPPQKIRRPRHVPNAYRKVRPWKLGY
jgi:hypothetical protein